MQRKNHHWIPGGGGRSDSLTLPLPPPGGVQQLDAHTRHWVTNLLTKPLDGGQLVHRRHDVRHSEEVGEEDGGDVATGDPGRGDGGPEGGWAGAAAGAAGEWGGMA